MSCFSRRLWKAALLLALALPASASAETLLLRTPAVSADHLAFVYGGDLWIANRDGSEPRRLTVHEGRESNPSFSKDGEWIAFSANYEGNLDVYLIHRGGGYPYRITYHPGADVVVGWDASGTQIVFRSTRGSHSRRYSKLFTIPAGGGLPEELPMPMAERASMSPDGSRIAYTPIRDAHATWKRYRGGQTPPIWLFDMGTYEIEEIPHGNATDTNPMWVGDTVYFLSDRNHTMNIFAYDTAAKRVRQVTEHADMDVKSASACDDMIIYEQGGRLHSLDLASGQSSPIPIQIQADLPHARPHFRNVADQIRDFDISPTGARAVFEARGDIFTVPAKKGEIRNLTRSSDVHERGPSWSPDGQQISYLSDSGGEYHLMVEDQKGMDDATLLVLGPKSFYYRPVWSPDSKKLVYTDKKLNLWYIDASVKKAKKIDTDTYDHPQRTLAPVWSPCSQWIAYTKRLDNQFHAIFLYDLENESSHQITDGMSDCMSPCFSDDGKYLFFSASTDFGLNAGWLDLSSVEHAPTRSLWVAVLDKTQPSPFAPESDDEKIKESKKPADDQAEGAKSGETEEEASKKTRIDLYDIDQRILDLGVRPGNYGNLRASSGGKLFYMAMPSRPGAGGATLHRFDLAERKSDVFMAGVMDYRVSANGKKLLYAAPGQTYGIVDCAGKAKVGDGKLDLSNMDMQIIPASEWRQIFAEAWRINRDFFYDPQMHGADWNAVGMRYQRWLSFVAHRSDLNYVLAEMIGELVVGHAYVGGGDVPQVETVDVGLLGTDYAIHEGAYRFDRIYRGENWNPGLRSPLTEPGINIREGTYLLAVNGQKVDPNVNIYSYFQKTSGRQTVLTVSSEPYFDSDGRRDVTVVPIGDETSLRHRAWIEDNRARVDELSGGRVAYVYMPDTANAGHASFNRYFFSQIDKQAVVIDERYNGGGFAADYVVDMLTRPRLSLWATREGKPFTTPMASIYGPKAMIINEYAGSGGDAMPYYFSKAGIGKLIGKTTWGGLVGIYDYPVLIDGGFVTAPRVAIYDENGDWVVENVGVPPDIEVEMTPRDVIFGSDPQLERAVQVVLEELEKNPPPSPLAIPAYPNRVGTPPAGDAGQK